MQRSKVAAAFLCLACLTGCGVYHRVTATATGQTYYTKDLNESTSGAMQFTDAKTGEKVILPSATVQRVSKPEFDRGVAK